MKILVAEDDPTSRLVLEKVLAKWGFEVISVKDGQAAWEALQRQDAPRLVVLDWVMPGMTGVEICKKIREQQHSNDHYTYVILLTALDAKEEIVQGLEAGADDYVIKPYDPAELRVRINAGKRIIDLTDRLLAAEEELRRQATTDPLTGVLNRRAVFEVLESECARATRLKSPFSIAIMDLDHFKLINDTYGHRAGDEVLIQCTQKVRKTLRRYDTLGRIGGEEFLIVAPGVDDGVALALFERVLKAIRSTKVTCDGHTIHVTASLGAVTSTGGVDADQLVALADKALYRAKESGRNRVEALAITVTQDGKLRASRL